MTVLLNVSKMLPGVHKVRGTRANGDRVETWYAWRGGGPVILKAVARSDALLAEMVEQLAPTAIEAYQNGRKPKGDDRFLAGLIQRYLEVGMDGLAPRTQTDRRKFLDRAREEQGELEIRALESRRARPYLLRWRDRYRATPKTADELLANLSAALQWAVDRGELANNPLHEFPRLYTSNRADIIWTDDDLTLLAPHEDGNLSHAVAVARLTGLRMGDLVKIPRSAVRANAIVWQTNKSRGKRTVVIPITDELRLVLDGLPTSDKALTLLFSLRGLPWTENGLASAFRRAKVAAETLYRRQANDPQAECPVRRLRFHDLRGTAVTNFIRAGLSLEEVATIVGWSKARVEQIALRYVTAEAIGLAMVERMRQNKAGRER